MSWNPTKLSELNYTIYDKRLSSCPDDHWPQPGWFGLGRKVIFIGQNPGMMTRSDEPWEHNRDPLIYLWAIKRSPTGKVIARALRDAQMSWDDIAYTNIVKSPTLGNREPSRAEVDFYLPLLYQQINLYQPQKAILFGNFVRKIISENSKKNVIYYNSLVAHMFVDHPAYVLRTGKELEYIKNIVNFIGDKNA